MTNSGLAGLSTYHFGVLSMAFVSLWRSYTKNGTALVAVPFFDFGCVDRTRRIPRRLRRGIPSCRHPIRLPFSFFRAAAAGSGACAASNPAICSCVHQCFVATPAWGRALVATDCSRSTPADYGIVLRSTRTIAPASVFPLVLSHNFSLRFCTFRRFHRRPSLFPCKTIRAMLQFIIERMKTVHPKQLRRNL